MKNKFSQLIEEKKSRGIQNPNPFNNLTLNKQKDNVQGDENSPKTMNNIYHNLIKVKTGKETYHSIKLNKRIVILQEDQANLATQGNTRKKVALFVLATIIALSSVLGLSVFLKNKAVSSNSSSELRLTAAKSYFEGYSMGNPEIYNNYFGENAYVNDWSLNTIEPINEIEEITQNRRNALSKITEISYRENLANEAGNNYAVGITFTPLVVNGDEFNNNYSDIYDYMSQNQNKVRKSPQTNTITYNLKQDEKTGKYIINGNRHSALDRVAQANMIIVK